MTHLTLHSMNNMISKKPVKLPSAVSIFASGTAGMGCSHSFVHKKYMYQYIPSLCNAVLLKNCIVAYFCHHLSDNYVVLSDLYVDFSDL